MGGIRALESLTGVPGEGGGPSELTGGAAAGVNGTESGSRQRDGDDAGWGGGWIGGLGGACGGVGFGGAEGGLAFPRSSCPASAPGGAEIGSPSNDSQSSASSETAVTPGARNA